MRHSVHGTRVKTNKEVPRALALGRSMAGSPVTTALPCCTHSIHECDTIRAWLRYSLTLQIALLLVHEVQHTAESQRHKGLAECSAHYLASTCHCKLTCLLCMRQELIYDRSYLEAKGVLGKHANEGHSQRCQCPFKAPAQRTASMIDDSMRSGQQNHGNLNKHNRLLRTPSMPGFLSSATALHVC